MVDAKNLGIMSRRPVVNEAGDILLDYDHGSLYADDKVRGLISNALENSVNG